MIWFREVFGAPVSLFQTWMKPRPAEFRVVTCSRTFAMPLVGVGPRPSTWKLVGAPAASCPAGS